MGEPITLTAFFGVSKAGVDIFIKISKALKLIESIESKLEHKRYIRIFIVLRTKSRS
jgi:hypothetical protein